MPRRESYSDTFTGEIDSNIRRILYESSEESVGRKSVLLNVIKNELTERQREIIMLYYFKEKNTTEIADMLGISPQAVSAAMARGRKRILRIMQYIYKFRK
ncbi:MAG: sigma-70 family RNA polymerase sigma factor [Alistipes sp.]|nr:sigma-70 family RNA polymerase sigma factor [Alistipes sp.]